MALKKNLSWVSTSLFIFIFILMPFVQPSCARFQGGTATAGDTGMATQQEHEAKVDKMRFEDSERLVPTGPDPLHHNGNNPERP